MLYLLTNLLGFKEWGVGLGVVWASTNWISYILKYPMLVTRALELCIYTVCDTFSSWDV